MPILITVLSYLSITFECHYTVFYGWSTNTFSAVTFELLCISKVHLPINTLLAHIHHVDKK